VPSWFFCSSTESPKTMQIAPPAATVASTRICQACNQLRSGPCVSNPTGFARFSLWAAVPVGEAILR
jgi:hypothetical protein